MTDTKTDRQFIRYIAILQVFTIILVVFGHSLYFCTALEEGNGLLINNMMFSFRMPTFMFVSGFLMMTTTFMRGKVVSPVQFTKSKILRLLLPFFMLTAIVYTPRALLSAMASERVEFGWMSFANAFLYYDSMPIPYYWFLHSSFTLLTVTYLALYFAWRRDIRLTYVVLVMILLFAGFSIFGPDLGDLFSIQRTVSMASYFLVGVLCAYCGDSAVRFIGKNSVICLIVFGTMWAIGYFYLFNTPFRSVCSLLGIGMCLSFAMMLSHCRWTVFDHLMGANYIIFLQSWFFNALSQQVLAHFVELPWYIYSALSFVSGIYVPYLFYRGLMMYRDNHIISAIAFCMGQNLRRD